jgi:hypothetical protein
MTIDAGARLALTAALIAWPIAAWSGYTCKPPNGPAIYRDDLPAECKDVEIRELNPDGSLKRVIPAPLTPEERRRNEESERKQLDCQKQKQDQQRKDNSLLSTYPSEDDLKAARFHALANEKALIDQQNQKLKELKTERKRLDEEAEFYPRQAMPEELKRNMENNAALRDQAGRTIEHILADMERINDRYETDLKRYRELVAGTAKPLFHCAR